VYFSANGNGGQFLSVPANATTPQIATQVAQNQSNPTFSATDGNSVYWSDATQTGSIMKLSANGSVAPLVTGQAFPQCLAVDATSVYWINGQGASVMRAAK
jgi:hypothetical protein